jgi:hypothetical protein
MPADPHDRSTTRLNRLVAGMLGIAALVAIVAGVRSLSLAQTGELRAPPSRPGVLAQPELERQAVTVRECTDARGRPVYTSESCTRAADAGRPREVDVTTIELAPRAR